MKLSECKAVHYKKTGEFFVYHCPTRTLVYIDDQEAQKKVKEHLAVVEYDKTPLQHVGIAVTSACNLRCSHCYVNAGYNKHEHLALDVIERVFKLNDIGTLTIAITGGEPFCHPRIFEILDMATKYDLSIRILTNGTLINKEVIKRLLDFYIADVCVSLDGIQNTHDTFRGVRGAYKRTVNALDMLTENSFPVTISTVLHKGVINELPTLYSLITERWEIQNWALLDFYPWGRGKKTFECLRPEPEELVSNLIKLHKIILNSIKS